MTPETAVPSQRELSAPSLVKSGATAGAQPLPRRPSRAWLRFFDFFLSLYVPAHFRALRLASAHRFPLTARPLVVCINHPSWWDPLTSILLSRYFLPEANHYAPIDAVSLGRYGTLRSLGLFPVEQGTPRGAVQFLRGAQHILSDGNSLLWLTPQGGFTDVRSRPVVFKSGLNALIRRLDRVSVLPLAYEYTFWDEKLPEILANCGEPLVFTRGQLATQALPGDIGEEPGQCIADALTRAQNELSQLAATRDASRFHTILAGEIGVSYPRALVARLLAALHGVHYTPNPTDRPS